MSILEQLKSHINNHRNIFITGGGGVGKSYLLGQLVEIYPNMALTSTTGVSAVNIGGQTIHSWAHMGICDKSIYTVYKGIKRDKKLLNILQNTKMLAIDEISMLDAKVFEYLNSLLQLVHENNKLFGGIQLIVIGDFFQLPPVGKYAQFCFKSPIWDKLNFKVFNLTKVYRQSDENVIKALNNIRVGKIFKEDMELFYSKNVASNVPISQNILHLYSLNKDSDAHNSYCFNKLDGKTFKYTAKDMVNEYNPGGFNSWVKPNQLQNNRDISIYKQFQSACKYPFYLELKRGCRVMLLKNLDTTIGLANGSCGTVTELTKHSVEVEFDNGVVEYITPATMEYKHYGVPKIRREQLPLRLAYACSIHKSQGMTFNNLLIDFDNIFADGQAYVALSRISNLDGLILKHFNPNKIYTNQDVKKFYHSFK